MLKNWVQWHSMNDYLAADRWFEKRIGPSTVSGSNRHYEFYDCQLSLVRSTRVTSQRNKLSLAWVLLMKMNIREPNSNISRCTRCIGLHLGWQSLQYQVPRGRGAEAGNSWWLWGSALLTLLERPWYTKLVSTASSCLPPRSVTSKLYVIYIPDRQNLVSARGLDQNSVPWPIAVFLLCTHKITIHLWILDTLKQVLHNQKQEPLLYSAAANNTKENPSVVLKFQPGSSLVPLR